MSSVHSDDSLISWLCGPPAPDRKSYNPLILALGNLLYVHENNWSVSKYWRGNKEDYTWYFSFKSSCKKKELLHKKLILSKEYVFLLIKTFGKYIVLYTFCWQACTHKKLASVSLFKKMFKSQLISGSVCFKLKILLSDSFRKLHSILTLWLVQSWDEAVRNQTEC